MQAVPKLKVSVSSGWLVYFCSDSRNPCEYRTIDKVGIDNH